MAASNAILQLTDRQGKMNAGMVFDTLRGAWAVGKPLVTRGRVVLGLAKETVDRAQEQKEDSDAKSSSTATAGGGMPDPGEDPKKKEYKKSNFEKGDKIDIERFSNRISHSGGPKLEDPKTGEYLVKDFAANSGREHGGSYWKLCNRNGERLATFAEDGTFLRK